MVGRLKSHRLATTLGTRNLFVSFVVALLSVAPLGACAYVCSDWVPTRVWNPAYYIPKKRGAYQVYNNTGVTVFVYHQRSGTRYTFRPGQSGYLATNGGKLEFHPSELRCGSPEAGKECIIRFAMFGQAPGIVLELPRYRPAAYVRPRVAVRRQPRQPTRATQRPPSGRSQSYHAGDAGEILRTFLERMVHIYCHSRGAEKERKLADLRSAFNRRLRGRIPRNIYPELERYESVCRCIHEQIRSGAPLATIFKERRCGGRSTKQIRAEIVAGFRHQTRYSQAGGPSRR